MVLSVQLHNLHAIRAAVIMDLSVLLHDPRAQQCVPCSTQRAMNCIWLAIESICAALWAG